jgi:hypothetical protein
LVVISVAVEPRERPAQVSTGGQVPARRLKPWSAEAARVRLLAAVLAEGSRCPKARWSELATVVRELADRLDNAVGEPEKPPPALRSPESL